MRALKALYSVMGDLMWVLSIFAFAVLVGLFPKVAIQPVPYFGTALQALIYLMVPAIILLVGFNMLSGRWPAAGHRTRNIWVSRIAFFALVAIALVLFVMNKGETGLPVLTVNIPAPAPVAGTWTFDVDLLAKFALGGAIFFAFFDWWFTKGDDYLASSTSNAAFIAVQQDNANLRAQLAERDSARSAGLSPTEPSSAGASRNQPPAIIRVVARDIKDILDELPVGSMIQVPAQGLTVNGEYPFEIVRSGGLSFMRKLEKPAVAA